MCLPISGGYSDWQRASLAGQAEAREEERREEKKAAGAQQKKPARTKLNYKESRELAGLPAKIEALENEQSAIVQKLSDPALYRDGSDEATRLQKRNAQIEEDLLALLTRWEALGSKT